MNNIKVYVKDGCPWCIALEGFMREKGIQYESIEVRHNPEKFKEMVEISGQEKSPTVVINDRVYPDTDKESMEKIFKELGIIPE